MLTETLHLFKDLVWCIMAATRVAGTDFAGLGAAMAPLLQAYVDIRKRLRGAPTSGRVSLVVTDIESYSGDTTF